MNETHRPLSRRQLLERLAMASAAVIARADSPTRLKAAWVNHYVYVAPDLNQTVDWYHQVFGMQIAHRGPKEAHLWYGDAGGDTCMIVRQGAPGANEAKIINFAFTLDRWDRKAVEADLKRRGLDPVSDTDRCFRFKDMEGFDIAVCAANYMQRPRASGEKPAVWKALSANHVVENSRDYGKLRDWYEDLLALKITHDSGRDVYMWLGDTVWIPTASRAGGKTSAELGTLDHVAYTIADYDNDAVKAELEKHNMQPRQDTMLSFNCRDVNNFKTQVCDKRLVPEAEKRPPAPGRGPQNKADK
jgi:catechol 2,3-dioxygenase-like lactoylglutathione lyase family enzyme